MNRAPRCLWRGSPAKSRVIVWHRSTAFDMNHVCRFARDRNFPITFAYPTPNHPTALADTTAGVVPEVACFDMCDDPKDGGKTFVVFEGGTLVGWATTWDEMLELRSHLSPTRADANTQPPPLPHDAFCMDTMAFEVGDDPSHEDEFGYIDAMTDTIVLSRDDAMCKLPFSYALAHSIYLDALEDALKPVTSQLKMWQQRMFRRGMLLLSLRSLRKHKTHLLMLHEYVVSGHHTSTSPRVFWVGDTQRLRQVYRSACDHLEIESRGLSLKGRLDSLLESLSYLHDEAHSALMECLTVVIIILIMLEIAVTQGLLPLRVNAKDKSQNKSHESER